MAIGRISSGPTITLHDGCYPTGLAAISSGAATDLGLFMRPYAGAGSGSPSPIIGMGFGPTFI